jgi:branched-chain amino acid transport system ATP-binding protein
MRAAPLRTEGLSVSYGGVKALVDVDIEVREQQLVGLIGPNGAGKTTFIDAVTGFAASTGAVRIAGNDCSRRPPHQRARLGVTRTWQAAELFDDLTVRENLQVASGNPSLRQLASEVLRGRVPRSAAVDEALALMELTELADARPEELGQGQRKLVGVARALVAEPHVLLLDEPAAGLDTDESQQLGRRLRRLISGGVSMLLIDHDMGLVLNVCDFVVVLNFGKVIAQGTPDQVRTNPSVVEAYLGESGKQQLGLVAGSDG